MSSISHLLSAYEDSYSHKWESITSSLEGVDDALASWQPPYYTDAERFPGDPDPGTINWYVAHLEHCLRHYTEILRTRTLAPEPPPPPANASFTEYARLLEQTHQTLRSLIATHTDEDLEKDCRPGMHIDLFIRNVTRHNAWHAGQIALVKRMANQQRLL